MFRLETVFFSKTKKKTIQICPFFHFNTTKYFRRFHSTGKTAPSTTITYKSRLYTVKAAEKSTFLSTTTSEQYKKKQQQHILKYPLYALSCASSSSVLWLNSTQLCDIYQKISSNAVYNLYIILYIVFGLSGRYTMVAATKSTHSHTEDTAFSFSFHPPLASSPIIMLFSLLQLP